MLTPAQKTLFDEAFTLAASQGLNLREASTLLGAEARHYVRIRDIAKGGLRFRLLNYFRVRKIEKLRAQLATEAVVSNAHPVVMTLEEHFTKLEFGVNPFSPAKRKLLRKAILCNDHSVQAVQAAFRSLAVSKSKNHIRYREVGSTHVRLLAWTRDVLVGVLIALYAMIFHGIATDGCITCSLAGWAFLTSHAAAAVALACGFMQDAAHGSLIFKSMRLGRGCLTA